MRQSSEASSSQRESTASASNKPNKSMQTHSNRKHELVPELLRLMSRLMSSDGLEIEVKLGIIQDRRTRKRISIWADSDILITKQKYHETMNFISGVSKDHFDGMEREIAIRMNTNEHNQVNLAETVLNIDKCFKDNYRITQRDGQEKLVKKSRVQDFIIYRPKSMYDLKISLSTEVEFPVDHIQGEPTLIRRKERRSYNTTLYQFDFTIIEASAEQKSSENKYEFEMEVSDIQAFRSAVGSQSEEGNRAIQAFLQAVPMVVNTQDNPSASTNASNEQTRSTSLDKPSSPFRPKRKHDDTPA